MHSENIKPSSRDKLILIFEMHHYYLLLLIRQHEWQRRIKYFTLNRVVKKVYAQSYFTDLAEYLVKLNFLSFTKL